MILMPGMLAAAKAGCLVNEFVCFRLKVAPKAAAFTIIDPERDVIIVLRITRKIIHPLGPFSKL